MSGDNTENNKQMNTDTDIFLETQLEAIRNITTPVDVDVTDAVMKRIAEAKVVPMAPTYRARRRLIMSAAAACLAGIIVTTSLLSRRDVMAAGSSPATSTGVFDVYSFCYDYADEGSVESAVYDDNPITELI